MNAGQVGVKLGGAVIPLVIGGDLVAPAGKVIHLAGPDLLVAPKAMKENQRRSPTRLLVVQADAIISR